MISVASPSVLFDGDEPGALPLSIESHEGPFAESALPPSNKPSLTTDVIGMGSFL